MARLCTQKDRLGLNIARRKVLHSMGIAAVRDGKLAIAVCIMHVCVLFACTTLVIKMQPRKSPSQGSACLATPLSACKWWSVLVLLFGGAASPVVGYILTAAHISLFKDLLHHAALALASLLVSYLVLPLWYHSVLWPVAVSLAAKHDHKRKQT